MNRTTRTACSALAGNEMAFIFGVITTTTAKENAMEKFLEKHRDIIQSTLKIFDRVVIKGHLRSISFAEGMTGFMARHGFWIKDFDKFVQSHTDALKDHADDMTARLDRPYLKNVGSDVDKEETAAAYAKRDKVTDGLICVISAVEACQSFKVGWGDGKPRLLNKKRKCLCLYYYYMDREFGKIHVRIQTWAPFTIQICLNAHEWLAREMDKAGVGYEKDDNCFTRLPEPAKAQKLADGFSSVITPRKMTAIAAKVNPLLKSLLKGMAYRWGTDQAEYSTDVVFKSAEALVPLFPALLAHSLLRLGSEDVITYLGKRYDGRYGRSLKGSYQWHDEGARCRFQAGRNALKMYIKGGQVVLRVETVINDPYDFRILRKGKRKGRIVLGWFPMCKDIHYLQRYAEICEAANGRYLDALAAVDHPAPAIEDMCVLSAPVRVDGKSLAGFNPANKTDIELFKTVMRGGAFHGFKNKNVVAGLFGEPANPRMKARFSARATRLLKRLKVRGFVKKVPRSRLWRVTEDGWRLMGAALSFYKEHYPQFLENTGT